MKRLCLTAFTLAGLLICGFTAPVISAQEIPVGAIPGNAAVVMRLGDPDKGIQKLTDLVSNVDPSQATGVGTLGFFAGALIDNPAKAGIKKGGDWWFAGIVKKGEKPGLIIAVEHSDLAALKDAVGESYEYVEHGGWVLYTKDADAAAAIRKVVAGDAESIESAADEATRKLFMSSEAALFVNVKELSTTFSDEIGMAREQIHIALSEADNFAMPVEGFDMQAIFKMYGDMADAILDAIGDLNSFSVGVQVAPEGLTVMEHLDIVEGSGLDKALKIHKPSKLASLAQIPSDQHVYTGLHCDMESIQKWSMKLVAEMFDFDDEKKAKMDALVKKMEGHTIGEYSAAFSAGDLKSGLFNTFVISNITDAAGFSEVYGETFELMSGIGSNQFVEQEMVFTPGAETISGKKVDHLLLKQEFNSEAIPAPFMEDIFKMIYGPEGYLTRIAYLENHILQTAGGGSGNMEKLLGSVASPKLSPSLAKTRGMLLEDANLVILADPASLLTKLGKVVIESGRAPIPQIKNPAYDETNPESKQYIPAVEAKDLDNLGIAPSYIGWSAATGEGELNVKAHFPVEQMRSIYKLVMFGINLYGTLGAQSGGLDL